MFEEQILDIIQKLKKRGIIFLDGLNEAEFNNIEKIFNITFPPDLKRFLEIALPTGEGFYNWRLGLSSSEEKNKIQSRINWPLEGILFDVEFSDFWMDEFGEKPLDLGAKKEIVINIFHQFPKLVPIYSHRFIPSNPNEEGNPVFSIYQSDIIYYGSNLIDYFNREFGLTSLYSSSSSKNYKYIKFWSNIAGL